MRAGSKTRSADGPVRRFKDPAKVLKSCTDDVGLIDEGALEKALAEPGRNPTVLRRNLTGSFGCVRILGRLAVADTHRARTKAAALRLDRAATTAELAKKAKLTQPQVRASLPRIASLTQLGRSRWVANEARDGLLGAFAQAAQRCCDDVGHIDETRLRSIIDDRPEFRDRFEELVEACGFVRLNGQLATDESHPARLKAALIHLDRSATTGELAEKAGLTHRQVRASLPHMASLTPVGRWRWVANEARGGLLGAFAQAAQRCCDDVGLIDEDQLQSLVAGRPESRDRFEELTEACGFVRLTGQLAADDTQPARLKAALIHLDRSATAGEVAATAALSNHRAYLRLPQIASLTRVGPTRWVANEARSGLLGAFAEALQCCCDEVGLIDETRLRSLVADRPELRDRFEELAEACGLVRLNGQLATDNTARAATKAALLHLGRPATIHEIVELTGRCDSAVREGLRGFESVRRTSDAAVVGLLEIIDTADRSSHQTATT